MGDVELGPPAPLPADSPDPLESIRRRLEEEDARWAGEIMRRQARRSWWVPLLALPTAQVATSSDIPREFLAVGDEALAEARTLGWSVLELAHRVSADLSAGLDDNDARQLLQLTLVHRHLLIQLFGFSQVAAELLGLPPGLTGEGLVRRLAQSFATRPEPAGRLAVLGAALLDDLVREGQGRDYIPLPHARFTSVTRALDQRCYALGLRTWADGLRHAASVWTPETWRGVLMGYAAGALKQVILDIIAPVILSPAPPKGPSARPRHRNAPPRERHTRELTRLREEVATARSQTEAARLDAAAARRREAELVQARDRAQVGLAELRRRYEEVEGQLRAAQGMVRALEATLARLRQDSTPPTLVPAPVPPPPLPNDLLRGRTVYFFTGQERAAAARAQAESLRALGAADIRLYDLRQGQPGPDVFPPGSVVVVDTRFVGHRHTDELEARVRRSDVVYVPLQAGEGGLAAKLAQRLGG